MRQNTRKPILFIRCRNIRQAGFGLLEAMITMLIMSFGLLAIAYMETWGFRYGQESGARGQASVIAYDLMDRIRATGVAPADGGNYTSSWTFGGNDSCIPTLANATNDRNCFYLNVGRRIPDSAAVISTTTLPSIQRYNITIAWLDRFSEKLAADGETPTISECAAAEMLASSDSSNGLSWIKSPKPSKNLCMHYISWSMTP
jgi:type IV pilus assembly protein PilV